MSTVTPDSKAASRLELVERFFAGTAKSYDFIVDATTLGADRRWKRAIVGAIPAGARRILDLASGTGRLTRLHGSFVPDEDVRRVVEFVKKQATPSYSEELQSLSQESAAEEQAKDEVYEQAKDLILTSGQASASLIQRRLRVGYPRAARMVERMEEEGLVSAPARDGRREVIGRKGPVGEGEEA